MNRDQRWMAHALNLAERGRYGASPNPMVGACLVKGDRLVSEGFHREYGKAHAEVMALKRAGKKSRGATLYVTLEPCSTFGKTPPCLDLIVESKVKRVVYGLKDPNPVHRGKAKRMLKKAGIQVKEGVLAKQVEGQNEAFVKWIKTGRPFVTLKMAQSLDGKIATKTGRSKWISGKASQSFVHELRAEQDAILIGKNTLFKDDPSLTLRGKVKRLQKEKPWRIALCPDARFSMGRKIFKGSQQTLLAISRKSLPKLRRQKKAVTYLAIPEKKGKLDLGALLKELGGLGVSKILVEGGGELAWELLDQKLVDKLYWIVAPKILGGRDAVTSVEGAGVSLPASGETCKIEAVHQLGEDFMFEARMKH